MIALSVTTVWAGFSVGCVLIVAGVYLLTGLPGALIAAGVLVAGAFLLLADIRDEPRPPAAPEETA